MKNFITIILTVAFVVVFANYSNAQCGDSQEIIPIDNAGFEDWANEGNYEDLTGDLWGTTNKIVDLNPLTIQPNVTKDSDAHTGNYSAKLTTTSFNGLLTSASLFTGIFNPNLANPLESVEFGKPFSDTPDFFKVWYKYEPIQGDSAEIYCYLEKGANNETRIATAYTKIYDATSEWTELILPFEYESSEMPESITLVFASSSRGDVFTGQVGNTLYVDDIELIKCLTPPSITSQPVDATTPEGVITTFSITVDNATSYQWYESTNGGANYNPISDNGTYSGTNTPILSIIPTLAMDGNLYQCIATGITNPPALSNSATLSVIEISCDIPTNANVTEITATSSLITWDAVSGSSFYQVKYRVQGTTAWQTLGTAISQRSLPNLMFQEYYEYKVRAECEDETWSDFTEIGVFYTASCLVQNDIVANTTPNSALITWNDVSGSSFYQVKYRIKGTTAWLTLGADISQRNLPNLTAKKLYQYKVRAQCEDGTWSQFTEIGIFYTSSCSTPTGVAAIYLDNTRMRVRWDNNLAEIKAKVRYREVGTSTWLTQNSQEGSNYIYINNLIPNATYQYRVRSNCDGNDWSDYTESYFHDLSATNARIKQEETTLAASKIYPNPTRDILNIEFETLDAEEVSIIISDNLGKNIHRLNETYQKGIQIENIDISNFTNGYYFITIRSKKRVETQKFMKIN